MCPCIYTHIMFYNSIRCFVDNERKYVTLIFVLGLKDLVAQLCLDQFVCCVYFNVYIDS